MKDLKISRELLSEVLKIEVVKHSLFNKRTNSFNVTYMQSEDSLKANWMLVNIYEFAFKCQEWGDSKGYDVCPKMDSKGFYRLLTDDNIIGLKIEDRFIFSEDIEPSTNRIEAILKACEWILKETKDKH